MKYILFSTLFFTSCLAQPSYIEGKSNNVGNISDILYIKDTRTGLCFAEVGTGNSYSFTCVPCDSLKNLK